MELSLTSSCSFPWSCLSPCVLLRPWLLGRDWVWDSGTCQSWTLTRPLSNSQASSSCDLQAGSCHGSQVSTPPPLSSLHFPSTPMHSCYTLTLSESSTQAATLSPSVALLCLTVFLQALTSFLFLLIPTAEIGESKQQGGSHRNDVVLFNILFWRMYEYIALDRRCGFYFSPKVSWRKNPLCWS